MFPFHRTLATAAASVVLGSSMATPLFAQTSSYTDVPSGAYYESAAAALRAAGALDSTESRFRPDDLATRAELVKLLVSLNDTPLRTRSVSSFDDISVGTWYSAYFETAAEMQWVRGDRDCYNRFRPCTARPADRVNRAEAAALIARTFDIDPLGLAPPFPDSASHQWYYPIIQTVADHCILQGDDLTGNVRPAANMNRAEMVVMFHRAMQNLQYGRDCGVLTPRISSVTVQDDSHIRLTFTTNILSNSAGDASHYTVVRDSNGQSIGISDATVVNARTVDLTLSASLDSTSSYVIRANNLVSVTGVTFSSTAMYRAPDASGHLIDAVAMASTRVRLRFDTDIDSVKAKEQFRYSVTRVSDGSTVGIASVDFIDDRTVDVYLRAAVQTNVSYRIAGTIRRSDGVDFTDSRTFVFAEATPKIESAMVESSTVLTVVFSTDLDPSIAQQSIHYTVTDSQNDSLPVQTATLLSDKRTVQLRVLEPMLTQRSYTITVVGLKTSANTSFNDAKTIIYGGGNISLSAVLNAVQEVPSVPYTVIGSGTGTFSLRADGLHYDIAVSNLSGSITGAHFHRGASGVAGPVLQAITFSVYHSSGVWNLSDTDRAALLDGNVYVNVHTTAYPDGEIRGQIHTQ